MAERLHPGVYVEEVSSGVRPIEGVGTSTAAFIGEASRGMPGVAHFLTSFEDYTRIFGGHLSGEKGFLGQVVAAFFAAGGRRAYAVRVLSKDAKRGESTAVDAAYTVGSGDPGLQPKAVRFVARGSGAWADAIRIAVSASKSFPGEAFDVEVSWVEGGTARVLETHTDLRMDPKHEDYVVDSIATRSRFIDAIDAFQEDRQKDAPTFASIPEARPSTALRELGTNERYGLSEGAEVTFRWVNATTGDQKQKTIKLASGDVTKNTREDFAKYLKAQFAASSGAGDDANAFEVVPDPDTSGPNAKYTVQALLATRPRLALRPSAANATRYDLTGFQLAIKEGAAAAVPLDFSALTPAELATVSAAQLADRIKTALPSAKVLLRGSHLLVLGARTAAGNTLALEQTGAGTGPVQATATAGEDGAVVDDLDAVTMTISEKTKVGVKSLLAAVGLAPRVRAFEEDVPRSPMLLPVPTSNLRLSGGTDGPANVPLTLTDYVGDAASRTGLHALDGVDVNLVALPGKNDPAFISAGIAYCDQRGDCFFLADGPGSTDAKFEIQTSEAKQFVEGLPARSNNAAMYFPWIRVPDPVGAGKNPTRFVPPSGHVAGIFARTDVTRGVWKAPAGIEAVVTGALDLQGRPLVDADQDLLNPASLNCLRKFSGTGIVTWGARTLASDPEWRYVPVRRMALFLKESLRRGLKWAVFEPNDQELWDQIRTNITSFMLGLFRQGAFQGATPDEAFRVVCDRSTNPQDKVDAGIVTAQVAFAPLKPAEFVVIEISQKSLVA
ncbi:phage tail sheath family protein [Sorangium sp. So ce341]|uniref:phage tail sheath family protein n=1 Tax=Sorangium sp. So ce341 TaxID=3133302 RepID=UPI003F625F25